MKLGRQSRRSLLAAVTALAVSVVLAVPALAGGSVVTRGDFTTLVDGTTAGLEVGGHAQMVRRANGTTKVNVQVTGLVPGVAYATHVHAGTCANLGPHYFFGSPVADGDGPAEDEIWPGPITANAGGIATGKTTVGDTAGPTAGSVVVHATDTGGPRIACADLS
jgi:hypothetical protein